MEPTEAHSKVLSIEEEAVIVAFRRHSFRPLDGGLYAFQPTIPHLMRSLLHRCPQRHEISRLPEVEGDKPKKTFKRYPIGYFHIDIVEVGTGKGKIRLVVAIHCPAAHLQSKCRERDRPSKFAYVELHERATKMIVAQFLRNRIAAVPCKIHTILTERAIESAVGSRSTACGIWFTNRKLDTSAFEHIFDRVCRAHEIDHRPTKVNHPWTNGQVERMNPTIKETMVKRYHYDTHSQFEAHVTDFIAAYNHARRLKTLQGLTPFKSTCKVWTSEPEQFNVDPTHHTLELNT